MSHEIGYILDGGYRYFAPDNSIRLGNKYLDYKPPDKSIVPEAKRSPPKPGDWVEDGDRKGYIMFIDYEGEEVSVKYSDGPDAYSLDQFESNYSSRGGRTKWTMS